MRILESEYSTTNELQFPHRPPFGVYVVDDEGNSTVIFVNETDRGVAVYYYDPRSTFSNIIAFNSTIGTSEMQLKLNTIEDVTALPVRRHILKKLK